MTPAASSRPTTDRPVIFSGPMVLALLAGRKVQTRRLASSPLASCRPGDRLWVRENIIKTPAGPAYAADGGEHYGAGGRLPITPCIHMPRALSRLTLVVTNVRRQRLQAITEADALAEGIVSEPVGESPRFHVPCIKHPNPDFPELSRGTAREMFAALWDTIHGSGQWLADPEVVALTFDVHHQNIDALATVPAAAVAATLDRTGETHADPA